MLLSRINILQSIQKLSCFSFLPISPCPIHVCWKISRSAGAPELISFMRDLMDGLVFRALHSNPLHVIWDCVLLLEYEYLTKIHPLSSVIQWREWKCSLCHLRGGECAPSMIIDFFLMHPWIMMTCYCFYEVDIVDMNYITDISGVDYVIEISTVHLQICVLCISWCNWIIVLEINSCGRWTRSVLNTRYSNMLALNGCKVFLCFSFLIKCCFDHPLWTLSNCSWTVFFTNAIHTCHVPFENLIAFCNGVHEAKDKGLFLYVYLLKQ